MIDVMDELVEITDALISSSYFQTVMEMETTTKFGDPGVVLATEYPYIYIQPMAESSKKETIGRAGYEVRELFIEVGVVIDQSEYFDPSTTEVSGLRELLKASSLLREEYRRFSNRGLSGLARGTKVPSIVYEPQVRGDAFTAVAKLSLIVEVKYNHQS